MIYQIRQNLIYLVMIVLSHKDDIILAASLLYQKLLLYLLRLRVTAAAAGVSVS